MAYGVQPELASEKERKYRKRAKVSRRGSLTQLSVDVTDASAPTVEGNVDMFLRQAMQRFEVASSSEMYDRIEGLKDVLMVDGEGQWDDDVRGARNQQRRPCLTLNRFIPMIAHVANEQRMARQALEVKPVGGGADKESAEIRQGLLRHIEIQSTAETIYDDAFERMIEKGWSWFRVVADWEDELSHRQVIKIEGFDNDFSIYGDPNTKEPTRKDQKWNFIAYDIPRGEYMAEYPESEASGLTNWSTIGDDSPGWITADTIRVAEYYYMLEEHVNSVRLIGGDGVWEDEIEYRDGLWYEKAQLEAMDRDQLEPEAVMPIPVELDEDDQPITRPSVRCKPMWCKINAVEILDGDKGNNPKKNTGGRRVAGKFIPMIHVCGRQKVVNGRRRRSGMVRNNRDAQRMYNYAVSGFIEMIALAPKSPFIVAAGQITEFKHLWDNSNLFNYPYLPYKPVALPNGQPAPPPSRQNIEPPVMALIQAIREFDNDLKIGFNIFDPSLGTAKGDQSGRAIAGLQAKADAANMNWMDNMRRAQVFCGEVILGMIPEIYDTARIVTIVRANKPQEILINQEFSAEGKTKNYSMATGKYSCTVSVGQMASRREKAVQSLMEVAKNVPQVAIPLLPLILENMDTPFAMEAAEIVKRMQPPELMDPQSPEKLQANFNALMAQHKQLVIALQRANETLTTKQLDNASKEYIAGLQAQAQIVATAMKVGSAESMAMATQEFSRIEQLLNMNHERIQREQDRAHEVGLSAMEAENQPEPATA